MIGEFQLPSLLSESYLILRRDTHLDSLVKRLSEKRVRRIVEPILAGERLAMDVLNDDFAFARDLGGPRGGRYSVDREYAAGRGRLDLCVRWPLSTGEVQRWAMELKVWRDTTPAGKGILTPPEKGVIQLGEYLERLGLDRGYLVVFDARPDAEPLPERISHEELEYEGRTIVFWRL